MKPLQSLAKKISPVLPHDMAEIVDTQRYGAVGTRKIKNSDLVVPVADKPAVGAGTHHLPSVIDSGGRGTVIVGLVTGASDLMRLMSDTDKKSVARKIVSGHSPLIIDVC